MISEQGQETICTKEYKIKQGDVLSLIISNNYVSFQINYTDNQYKYEIPDTYSMYNLEELYFVVSGGGYKGITTVEIVSNS